VYARALFGKEASIVVRGTLDRLADHPEILDGPVRDRARLRRSLRDLRRVNSWLGGNALSRVALAHLLRIEAAEPRPRSGGGLDPPLRVLDVGTGLADVPVALLEWSARNGIALEVEAVDSREETVAAAHDAYGDVRGLRLRVADGRSLPYPDRAFDVAHTSLLAHHLEPPELAACLGELRRVARLGVVVNDLDRTALALAGAWLVTRLFTRSPITRNDGPLSVRRAYRPSELSRIASQVGLTESARFTGLLGYRYALVLTPDPASDPRRINTHVR
jgi:ubiquinone/menaquinone biosynthesis C-methylase UbiE